MSRRISPWLRFPSGRLVPRDCGEILDRAWNARRELPRGRAYKEDRESSRIRNGTYQCSVLRILMAWTSQRLVLRSSLMDARATRDEAAYGRRISMRAPRSAETFRFFPILRPPSIFSYDPCNSTPNTLHSLQTCARCRK